MRLVRFLLLLSSLLAATGCPDPEPEVAPDAFAGELEHAVCAWLSECRLFPDEASCARAELVDHDLAQVAGHVTFDGAAATRCLDEIRALGCGQTPVAAFYFGSHEGEEGLNLGALHALGLAGARSCEEVLEGQALVGASCFLPDECASDACERPHCQDACCTGTCVDRRAELPDGRECDDRFQCQAGSYCGADTDTGVRSCRPRGQAGEACAQNDSCVESAYCDLNDGHCHALAARGPRCFRTARSRRSPQSPAC
jgi:hypothetical protein